jgi:hypothetical protein
MEEGEGTAQICKEKLRHGIFCRNSYDTNAKTLPSQMIFFFYGALNNNQVCVQCLFEVHH